MASVQRREAAKRDLVAQWVWYAENSSTKLADRFLEAVERTLVRLAGQPRMGAKYPFRSPRLRNMRRFPVGGPFRRIFLFYVPTDDGIDLVRVVDGARDIPSLFLDYEPD